MCVCVCLCVCVCVCVCVFARARARERTGHAYQRFVSGSRSSLAPSLFRLVSSGLLSSGALSSAITPAEGGRAENIPQ